MSNAEKIMSEIYNALVQIRYPKITTAEAKNLEVTILHGENRIFLLTWLLTEKSPLIATKLRKLEGAALEVELWKHYSQIGISTKKEVLLGNCTLEEQLSTLELLLCFIKSIYIESPTTPIENESIDNVIQIYKNRISNTLLDVKPQLNYSESMQYFGMLKKYLDEHQELELTNELNNESEKIDFTREYLAQNEERNNEDDKNVLLHTETKTFIETFSIIESWPKCNIKNEKSTSLSMDTDINNIYSNFSSLTKLLQATNEILETSIPKGLPKINTELNKFVEDIVISTEETLTIYNSHE